MVLFLVAILSALASATALPCDISSILGASASVDINDTPFDCPCVTTFNSGVFREERDKWRCNDIAGCEWFPTFSGSADGLTPGSALGDCDFEIEYPLTLTDANIIEALALSQSDPSSCNATYGYISNWDTGLVTRMDNLFRSLGSRRYNRDFNEDISKWDVSNVTTMTNMFYKASKFDSNITQWDVSKVKDTQYMFRDAESFSVDISQWDMSKVADMSGMFKGAACFDCDNANWYKNNIYGYNGYHNCPSEKASGGCCLKTVALGPDETEDDRVHPLRLGGKAVGRPWVFGHQVWRHPDRGQKKLDILCCPRYLESGKSRVFANHQPSYWPDVVSGGTSCQPNGCFHSNTSFLRVTSGGSSPQPVAASALEMGDKIMVMDTVSSSPASATVVGWTLRPSRETYCYDNPGGWEHTGGFGDCNTYSDSDGWCGPDAAYGFQTGTNGQSADQACCGCGGGTGDFNSSTEAQVVRHTVQHTETPFMFTKITFEIGNTALLDGSIGTLNGSVATLPAGYVSPPELARSFTVTDGHYVDVSGEGSVKAKNVKVGSILSHSLKDGELKIESNNAVVTSVEFVENDNKVYSPLTDRGAFFVLSCGAVLPMFGTTAIDGVVVHRDNMIAFHNLLTSFIPLLPEATHQVAMESAMGLEASVLIGSGHESSRIVNRAVAALRKDEGAGLALVADSKNLTQSMAFFVENLPDLLGGEEMLGGWTAFTRLSAKGVAAGIRASELLLFLPSGDATLQTSDSSLTWLPDVTAITLDAFSDAFSPIQQLSAFATSPDTAPDTAPGAAPGVSTPASSKAISTAIVSGVGRTSVSRSLPCFLIAAVLTSTII